MWHILAGTLASICYGWCLQWVLNGGSPYVAGFFLALAAGLTFTALDRTN